ncbi:hypothetical protein LP123_01795 [Moraxella bovis]|uniref:Uncharacterized protein n=1 Tax=Moraxella bovis TaxID=476 RepID=A0AAQ2SZV1_MORBO|nr:hypothetical protein [Moraxella bovis]AWY21254.1 hypothetical protein DQF64_12640 [Moraxella bovis]UYZ75443.1 hypothetical protein LP093_12030 [Moraxella bovis]UYZ78614.1 hypothetical protein LP115_01770 [Moraxella bovis]UYZ81507.1 hypothetical protein LP113_01800 [Moraxella bovis]UYZ87096.1 hypothetical protein LP094_01770 [Moraxella bovis]
MSNNTQIISPPSIDDIANSDIPTPSINHNFVSLENAIAEQRSIEQGDLEAQARKNEHHRSERWKNHFSYAFIGTFWVFWFFFVVMSAVLIWHWLTPSENGCSWLGFDNGCHWLNSSQLDHLKTIIVAVFASNVVANQQSKLK